MDSTPSSSNKSPMMQLEHFLEEYLVKKAPFQLPHGLKEFLVKIAPYLVIVTLILALPLILAAFGLSAVMAPFAVMGGAYAYGYAGWGVMAIISIGFTLVAMVLEIMALPGLFRRTYRGWKYLFYAQILSLIGSLLGAGSYGILGTLIGALISFYVLFQVKEMYKK